MSNILFIYPTNNNESLGIEYLSSSLKKAGHRTDLILHYEKEKYFISRLYKKIRDFKPDFVCFSVVTLDYPWACKVSKIIKKISNIPIVFGGIHVTSCPEETIKNKFVDFIILGEGDDAIVELVRNPDNPRIKNVWTKEKRNPLRPLLQDLDKLPFPDKELFYKEAKYIKDIYTCMTSKGCPFSCSYCFNNYMRKMYKGEQWVRRRSMENVIMELKQAKKRFRFKQVSFFDDCFIMDKDWLKKFIKKYKEEVNVPFRAISNPVFIDEENARLLRWGGCIKLQLGAQTPIEKIRKEICLRNDTNEHITKAVNFAKKERIAVNVDHIFGLPSEKLEDYREGLKFYIDLKPTMYFGFWLQYYPNTDIVEIGKKYGTLDDQIIKDAIRGRISYGNRKMNSELLKISRFLYWIPILPKSLSRFILRNNLHFKIFKSDIFNSIPLVIPHFYSWRLFKALILEINRLFNRRMYSYKMNMLGKSIRLPPQFRNLEKDLASDMYQNNVMNPTKRIEIKH